LCRTLPLVSGDSSCADHNVAWRVRKALGLDTVPNGVSPNGDDGIVYDISGETSKGGFGHPTCGGSEAKVAADIGAGVVVIHWGATTSSGRGAASLRRCSVAGSARTG